MLSCKQVSNTLSQNDYATLPPMQKFLLKLHVKLCVFCGKFNSQVMDSQDMCRCYKKREIEQDRAYIYQEMKPSQKDELKRLLARETNSQLH